MNRRIAIPLVVLAAIVAGAVLGERMRPAGEQARTQSRRLRTPAPTAVEEAGETAEVPPPPMVSSHVRVSKPLEVRSLRRSKPVAGRKREPDRPSVSRVPPRADRHPPGTSAAPAGPPGLMATQEGRDGSSQGSQPQESQPAPEGPPADVGSQAAPSETGRSRTPGLRPPVLLSEIREGYPPDGYLVVLDRGTLTPGLRVEAAEGRTVLKVLVRMDGTVGEVIVLASSGYLVLDQAAVDAARGWRFRPATRDGEPVDAWALIPVRFVIP